MGVAHFPSNGHFFDKQNVLNGHIKDGVIEQIILERAVFLRKSRNTYFLGHVHTFLVTRFQNRLQNTLVNTDQDRIANHKKLAL